MCPYLGTKEDLLLNCCFRFWIQSHRLIPTYMLKWQASMRVIRDGAKRKVSTVYSAFVGSGILMPLPPKESNFTGVIREPNWHIMENNGNLHPIARSMNPTFWVPSENLSFGLLYEENNDCIGGIFGGLMKNIQGICVNIRSFHLLVDWRKISKVHV